MRPSQRHIIQQALSAVCHSEVPACEAQTLLALVAEDAKEPPGNEACYKATSEVLREVRDALSRLRAARNQLQGITEFIGKDPF